MTSVEIINFISGVHGVSTGAKVLAGGYDSEMLCGDRKVK
jgi:hypothetical protein